MIIHKEGRLMFKRTNPNNFEDQVVKTLKSFRVNKKISQENLGKKIGVSRDTIARLEMGKHPLRLQMIIKWANALDIMLQDLLFKNESKGNPASSLSTTWSNFQATIVFNIQPKDSPAQSNLPNQSLSARHHNDGSAPKGLAERDIINMGELKDENKHESRTIVEEEVQSHDTTPAPDPIHSPNRNPYLDEVAVKSYGNPMKQYILEHRLFWHWVPEDKLAGLSIASVVEATLNQGEEKNVKWLFESIGELKAAKVFKWGISGFRTNYREETVSFFDAYFKRHVPEYTHL